MADLRVLQVLPSLNVHDGGGSSAAVHTTIAKARAGLDVTVAFADAGDVETTKELFERHGITVRGFPIALKDRRLSRRWAVSPRLAWWVVRNARRYDVIHVDAAWILASFVGALAAKVARRPVVLTPHESLTEYDVVNSPDRLRRAIKTLGRALYLRTLDLVVFSSRLELADSTGDRSVPAVVIPHPVAHDGAPADVARQPRRPATLGYLGRLHPKKNVDLLIRALPLLPAEVRLVVGGDGDLRVGLEELARGLEVSERVEWRGWLSPGDRDRFLEDIDLLVMPSAYECFGMVAAEALAAGVPVVVSSRTGVAEVVERHGGGLVCEPALDAVVRQVEAALRQHADLASDARRAALQRFTYDAYGRDIRAAYDALIARRAQPSS